MALPGGVGMVARNLPPGPAAACTTVLVLAADPGRPTAISTMAPGAVVPATEAWLLVVVMRGSWLARMSSVMPGGVVETWPGVVTAPGADTFRLSGTAVGAPRAT